MSPGMPTRLSVGPMYLDHSAATTPVDSRVLGAMLPFLDAHFGNLSSDHHFGAGPGRAVAVAVARA